MGLNSSQPVNANSVNATPHHGCTLTGWPSVHALFKAINKGDFNKSIALARHANINLCTVNNEGQNPIHLAISLNQEDISAQLVQTAAARNSIAIHQPDREGYTPLMLAIERGNIPLAKILITLHAAILADHDIHCSADRQEQKRRTIVHAHLLKHANGDTAQAHITAVNQGDFHFDKLIIGKHSPLREACKSSANALRLQVARLGVDVSYVLARILLTQWDERYHDSGNNFSTISPEEVHFIRKLGEVGGDLSEALMHVLHAHRRGIAEEATCALAVLELLCLGVSDRQAMAQAIASRDATAVRLLGFDGVALQHAVMTQAKAGTAETVQFLFSEEGADIPQDTIGVSALFQLAEDGHETGVRLLIQAGVPSDTTLAHLTRKRNKQAVKTMIHAGADGVTLLSTITLHDDATGSAAILIDVGVDPSGLLLDSVTRRPRNLHQARILIAAGASPLVAQARATGLLSPDDRDTLETLAREVLALQSLVARTSGDNRPEHIQTVGRILDAQRAMAQPAFYGAIDRLNKCAAPFATGNDPASSDIRQILAALKRADWEEISPLVANSPVADDAFTIVMTAQAPFLARLLLSAGVSATAAIADAGLTHDIDMLCNLVHLGIEPQRILWQLARNGAGDLAASLIHRMDIDLLELFRNVLKQNSLIDTADYHDLTMLIPHVIDGTETLARALEQRDQQVAHALVAAGVNIEATLNLAINCTYFAAIRQLVPIANPSAALAKLLTTDNAIQENQRIAAQVLMLLGADYSRACALTNPNAPQPAKAKSRDIADVMGSMVMKIIKNEITKVSTTP